MAEANNDGKAVATNNTTLLFECTLCRELLSRNSYSKKHFPNRNCRNCITAATAARTKQQHRKVVDGRKSSSGQARRPNNFGYCHYVDQLFAMQCFTDIAALRVFCSAKDVSESMAALQAAKKHGKILSTLNNDNSSVLCLCIGDGATPRTAVLCAFLQKNWTCVSIDPALQDEWNGQGAAVRGLIGVQGTLEEFVLNPPTEIIDTTYSSILLLCVHSHARFIGPHCTVPQIRQLFSSNNCCCPPLLLPTTIVSMPCCPTFRHVRDIGVPPHVQYDDDGVFSACRKIELWNF